MTVMTADAYLRMYWGGATSEAGTSIQKIAVLKAWDKTTGHNPRFCAFKILPRFCEQVERMMSTSREHERAGSTSNYPEMIWGSAEIVDGMDDLGSEIHVTSDGGFRFTEYALQGGSVESNLMSLKQLEELFSDQNIHVSRNEKFWIASESADALIAFLHAPEAAEWLA